MDGGDLEGRAVVLLVDREAAAHEAARSALPRRCELVSLRSGADFLEAVEAYSPDLVILDGRPPDGEGLALCRRLRARAEFQRIPVLFLTGRRRQEDLRCSAVRGDAFLSEPFDAAALRDAVRRLL